MSRAEDTVWEAGWDDHQNQQLRRLAELTLEQKLEWLEEAHAVVRQVAASRREDKLAIRRRPGPT